MSMLPTANLPMSMDAFAAFLPITITCVTAMAVMLSIAFKRSHWWNATVTVVGLNLALMAVGWIYQTHTAHVVTALFVIDGYACLFMGLILLATLACVTLSYVYMETHPGNREELYLLLTLSAAGGLVLVGSSHMTSLFIGMEMLSVPLYGLVAYSFQRERSLEAGIKYLVLSAMSSAFLLFGMALLYAQTGQLSFAGIQQVLETMTDPSLVVLAGLAMIFIAMAFKLSLVPFHLWTPDVYEGAPAPVTAFLATVSKTAVFAAFLRLSDALPLLGAGVMHSVLMAVAALSILMGNLLALRQANIKRLLGYSSIAHFGYLLIVVLISAKAMRNEAAAVYLVTYIVSSLVAFGVMVLASSPYRGADADNLHNYRGLFWTRPYLAALLTVAMLSLAGIPVTAGFIGKFYIVLLGVGAGLWWLLAALVIGSALGLYYYLRVMVSLFMIEPGLRRFNAPLDWGRTTGGAMLLLAALLVLLIGVYPQPLLQLIHLVLMGG